MRRREFIKIVGGAAVAWPLTVRAQQVERVPVIGFLGHATPNLWATRIRAFRQGLSEASYVEDRNVAIEYRWAEGHYDRLPALAAELVRRPVAVIAANGPAALVAKAATSTIPIVFLTGYDPVEFGLVASLNRPGGNLTGVSNLNVELGAKRLELLHQMIPTATDIALLVNPNNSNAEPQLRDLEAATRALGLQLHVLQASKEPDFDAAFAASKKLRAGALVIGTDGFFISQAEKLGALAARHAMPTIFQTREFALAGGLMSYGGSDTDSHRAMGFYVGRILKGEKPADLPVQQSTKAELIVNLKAAKAIGLLVPLPLLGRADEVIE